MNDRWNVNKKKKEKKKRKRWQTSNIANFKQDAPVPSNKYSR